MCDSLAELRVIGELYTGREADKLVLGETGVCAFSPEGSYLAWSCGSRKVVLIPWNKYKDSL